MRRPGRSALATVLGWLGARSDPHAATVRCRTDSGRRAVLRVHACAAGIGLSCTRPGPYVLPPLAVGRLRAALRDAVQAHALLAADEHAKKLADGDPAALIEVIAEVTAALTAMAGEGIPDDDDGDHRSRPRAAA
ncbi:hypothetical protein [Actinokineospora sp.]|uniref:hypothetical protein n=1 Tax=Actinokineospora sp. TaxID=1872133 RepID=UPI004037979B